MTTLATLHRAILVLANYQPPAAWAAFLGIGATAFLLLWLVDWAGRGPKGGDRA